MLRGNLDHRLESQPVELEDPSARALVVGLVDREDDRRPDDASVAAISSSAGTSPSRPSTTNTITSAVVERLAAVLDDELVERILARAEHPARIDERERRFPATQPGWEFVSRVVPAIAVTIARREPVMRLKSVDLPTLGRPTSTTVGLSAERFRACQKFS